MPQQLQQQTMRVSRRTVLKSGVSAAAVTLATLLTARKSDAAVTSMDSATVMRSLPGSRPVKRER